MFIHKFNPFSSSSDKNLNISDNDWRLIEYLIQDIALQDKISLSRGSNNLNIGLGMEFESPDLAAELRKL